MLSLYIRCSTDESICYRCTFWPKTPVVGIKSLLDAVGITALQVFVNTTLMKLVLLRNFKKIFLVVTTAVAAFKVYMLKPGEFEIWRMRIEQYIQMIDYALWEVIENGATLPKTQVVEGVTKEVPIKTAKEKAKRILEVKARSSLMIGIPNEHQLKFNSIKDAKQLLEAVEKRFGDNATTKKTQRNLLKQQYENFTTSRLEMLDQTFDRLQKLVSQLEFLGGNHSQEDVNQKLLRSLSSEWNTHVVVWRNKADLDTTSIDDLYNNLKVYELEVKGMPILSSSTQNMTFVSSSNNNTSSTNGVVNTVQAINTANRVSTASTQVNAASSTNIDNLSDVVICSFFSGHFARECRALRNQDNKNKESLRRSVPVETSTALVLCDGLGGYDWSDQVEEGPNYGLMAFSSLSSDLKLSTTKPVQNLSHVTRPMAPIIEDWVSDSEDESEPNDPQSAPSFVQTSKHVKLSGHSLQPVETPILAATPKPTSPKTNCSGKRKNRKTCFVCRSVDHLIKDCNFHATRKTQPTQRNYAHRGYNKQHTKKYPQKHIVPVAVLTKSKPVSVTAVRQVSANVLIIMVTRPRHAHSLNTKSNSTIRRHKTRSQSSKTSNSSPKVTAAKASVVWRPKCPIIDHDSSTSKILKRLDHNDARGRSKGNLKGGKISGKGKIKTGKLDFEDVYFVKELKFNLFSVSQMCDKKNKVLFTDSECLVLSPDFKLPDESQVLLRLPRENNMYNVNLKDIVPSGDLTCLFAKARIDESNLWHRRLGHVNFKTINKLVKGNLVRGLPTKVFENNNTCVACKKGKQHRASCKTKPNETSPILKTFITGLENQLSLKVKVIRSDNGTEFKNSDLNQFYEIKGIKKEFSVPRTPQQNGIAERKNRTLIEAARTMMADSLLPIPFWAEAVNTACYVQNRVLVTKPHNKTLYEFLHGRTPSIGFMRPFGCLVTIFNTLDPLGKFKRKVDEGFLVGYSVNSKAFRVFNSRTRIVQETLHVNFLENKSNIVSTGPTWLFVIDSLTKTMNYQPVTVGNQSNLRDAAFDGKEHDAEKPESAVNLSPSSSALSREQDDMSKKKDKGKSPVEYFTGNRDLNAYFEDYSEDNSNNVSAAGPIVPTAGQNYSNSTNPISAAGPSNSNTSPKHGKSSLRDAYQPPDMLEREDIAYI
nr:hypothetical protein [Tanacetum cinerariifolium]